MSLSWQWQHQQAFSLTVTILTLSHTLVQWLAHIHTDHHPPSPHPTPHTHTPTYTYKHLYCTYIDAPAAMTHTLLSPLSCRRSHIQTHMLIILPTPAGVQVPALSPSLPLLKSLIKTLLWIRGVKPFLVLPSSPFSPSSQFPFCLIENVYSRKDPGEGETCQWREGGVRTTN